MDTKPQLTARRFPIAFGAGLMPRLLPASAVSETTRWLLVESLYAPRDTVTMGGVALTVVALTCWFKSGEAWFTVWAALSLVMLALRLMLTRAYDSPVRRGTPELWTRRFMAGALGTAAIYGLGSAAVILYEPDLALVLFCITVLAGWIGGGSARNTASPAIGVALILVALLPVFLALMLRDAPFYHVLAALVLIQMAANFSISRYLSQQTLKLLLAEQVQAELNERLSDSNAALEAANTRLQRLSVTDSLTGIGNRRALDAALIEEWGRATRTAKPVALLMLDVDLFKPFNDQYGHPAGDLCLRALANALTVTLRRPGDLTARFGGEEFAAILPETDLAGAMDTAERLRAEIFALGVPHRVSPFGVVTVSIGVAVALPARPGQRPEALLAAADSALYRAKQAGRNRVMSQSPTLVATA